MGYRSEKQRPKASSGRQRGRRLEAVWSGMVLAITVMTIGVPLAAASPPSAKAAISKIADKIAPRRAGGEPDKAERTLPRARQRGGSSSLPRERAAARKPGVDGEVEGGTGAPRAREAKRAPAASGPSAKPPCVRDAVQFERGFGGDAETVVLTRCDGRPTSAAIEQLSILVRPINVARPGALASRIRRAAHREWLPGVRRIHDGLVSRLQSVVDRFQARKITLVSGYRPTSLGSFHQSARALDLHVDGVANEKLVEFCRTLADTGCGYYPNSSFVHLDVRPSGTGHVYWIDASGPGEPARYVSSWPPRDSASATSGIAPPDPAVPLDEHTHAGAARPPLGGNDTKIDARTTAPWWGGENAFTP